MNRVERLAAEMPSSIDAAIILSEANRFYFTGFRSSAGLLLVTRGGAWFFTDFRYIESARRSITGCEIVLKSNLYAQVETILRSCGAKNVGVEYGSITLAEYDAIAAALSAEVLRDDRLHETIKRLRACKAEDEIASLRRAQELTDRTFSYILEVIRPGVTEQDLILEMGAYMERLGNENRSFDFIAVSGPRTSLPHGKASRRTIEIGDFVTLDFGCMINGYFSDMTRTVAVGHASTRQKEIYRIVQEAQQKALEQIRAGISCAAIDTAARGLIADHGYGPCFGHGLGHGVGIEIHESPFFNQSSKEVLQAGNIMTVEPGIYLENQFGVRIEDMVVVTEDGCENLTHSPKELIIL